MVFSWLFAARLILQTVRLRAHQKTGLFISRMSKKATMENMAIVVFSFQAGSITPKVLADLIEIGIGFEGKYLRSSFKKIKNGNCNIRNRIKSIRECSEFNFFQLYSEKDVDCPSLFIHKRNTYDHLKMIFHADQIPSGDFFTRLATINGFNYGYIEDYEFNYWQNAELLYFYEKWNAPHQNLPKKSNGMPFPLEEEIVDISLNFGRNIEHPGMLFAIAPIMWMNKSYINSAYPNFLENKSLFLSEEDISDGICCLKLCENLTPNGADIEKIENIAKVINFSAFDAKSRELIKVAPCDPMSEINTVYINDEECREQVVWVADQGKQTNKSKAKKKLVNVFNLKGDRIDQYFEEY